MKRLHWLWTDNGLPRWVWRPLCWMRAAGHRDDSYGICAVCGKALG